MSEVKQTQADCQVAGVVIQPDAGNDGSALATSSRQAIKIAKELRLKWSRHAIQRVASRFGFKSKYLIPVKGLLALGATKSRGEFFTLQIGKAVFVCVRIRGGVKVVTVLRCSKTRFPQPDVEDSAGRPG